MQLPSSFEAEFRNLRGAEISALANAKDNQIQDAMVGVLRSTWTKTINPGPYTHADGDLTPQFEKFLSGDIWYAFIAMAVANVPDGDKFKFSVQCPQRHRDRQYPIEINLRTQLLDPPPPAEGEEPAIVKVRRLSAQNAKHLRANGNSFEDTVGGKRIVYKLQSHSDAKVIRELIKAHPEIENFTATEQAAVQAVEIEGLKSQTILNRYVFMQGVDVSELYPLHERMVANDCGLDTAIDTACPVCGWEREVELPFAGMYAPRKK